MSLLTREVQEAMQAWLAQAPSPEQQLDYRWIKRIRDEPSADTYWWLTWAGPFNEEEQQIWDRLFKPPVDEPVKHQLASLLKQSRERELEAALAEHREPHLRYPAIEIDNVRRSIANIMQFDAEIEREEPNAIVRQLYHGVLEDNLNYIRMIEATYEGDTDRYWRSNQPEEQLPTPDEMAYALSWVQRLIQQGLEQPATAGVSEELLSFLQERLHLTLTPSPVDGRIAVVNPQRPSETAQMVSAEAVRRFFETVLRESGYEGWQAVRDYGESGTRVDPGLRQVILSGESFSLTRIRHLLAHELAGHVARSFAGEHSCIGLLALGTQNYQATEEGVALYHERQVLALHGQTRDESARMSGMLATGFASGVVTPPQTFSSLYTFFALLLLLHRCLARPWEDVQTAQKRSHKLALERCLRTFRGVPDLQQAGVCYLQDVIYLRGLLLIDRIVAEDKTALDRLAVGKIAVHLLPLLEPLHLPLPPQPLRQLAYDPNLDDYILSFEPKKEEKTEEYIQAQE